MAAGLSSSIQQQDTARRGPVIEHVLPETAKSRRYSRRMECRAHSASCGVQAMQSGCV
jgi:hypothetical protein